MIQMDDAHEASLSPPSDIIDQDTETSKSELVSQRSQSSPKEMQLIQKSKRKYRKRRLLPQCEPTANMTLLISLTSKTRHLFKETDGLSKRSQFTDVILESGGENFHCHSFVLDVWTDTFRQNRLDGHDSMVSMHQYTNGNEPAVVANILWYLYGGTVEEMDASHLDKIALLARDLKMPDIEEAISQYGKTAPLTVENVLAVWTLAEKYTKEKAFRRVANFAFANFPQLVEKHGSVFVQNQLRLFEVVSAAVRYKKSHAKHDQKCSKSARDSGSINAMSNMKMVWEKSSGLQKPEAFSDAILVAKDGQKFHVHKTLLAFSSPTFAQMVDEKSRQNSEKLVQMEDVDGSVMEEFLRSIYKKAAGKDLVKVAKSAHALAVKYGETGLLERCETVLAEQEMVSIGTALKFLLEATEKKMGTGKKRICQFLYEKAEMQNDSSEWRQLATSHPQLVIDMLIAWYECGPCTEEKNMKKGEM